MELGGFVFQIINSGPEYGLITMRANITMEGKESLHKRTGDSSGIGLAWRKIDPATKQQIIGVSRS